MYLEIPSDHKTPKDSQLIVIVTGSPDAIKAALLEAANSISKDDKPRQGTSIAFTATTTVITPVWEGKSY